MAYPRFQKARNFKFVNFTTDPSVTTTTFVAVGGVTDLTIAAQAGDVIEAACFFRWNNEAFGGRITYATIVSSSVVTQPGNVTYGLAGGYGGPSLYTNILLSHRLVLTASDISNGLVTVRLLAKVDTAGTKTIEGVSGGSQFAVMNLGPQDAT